MKKHQWYVFQHEKLFKKQSLPHYQTHVFTKAEMPRQEISNERDIG